MITKRPIVVTICGSSRFRDALERALFDEEMAGRIALSIGFFGHLTPNFDMTGTKKAELDELHLRKIDMSDEILVLNVGGYIGESTRKEIDYAIKAKKRIRYLEPPQSNP